MPVDINEKKKKMCVTFQVGNISESVTYSYKRRHNETKDAIQQIVRVAIHSK